MNKIWIMVLLVVFASCQNSTQETVETSNQKELPRFSENAQYYVLDTNYSIITWIGSKPTGQHDGIIPVDSGFLAVDSGSVQGGEISILIYELQVMDIPKTEKGHQKLTNHLLSDDFFHADSFPKSRFEITNILPYDTTLHDGDQAQFESKNEPAVLSDFMVKNPTHQIYGNLEMRGVSKNISFPSEIVIQDSLIFAEAKFNIDRTDWNLSYSNEASVEDKAKDKFIYNTVNVGFKIKAIKVDSVR